MSVSVIDQTGIDVASILNYRQLAVMRRLQAEICQQMTAAVILRLMLISIFF